MAKQPELYTDPLTGVENDPYAGTVNRRTGLNPAAQSGTDALRAGLVDQAFAQQPAAMYSQFELPTGFSPPPSSYRVPSLESSMQPTTPKIRLGYDPDQDKYLVNNTVIDARDINTLQRVPELLQQPTSPETPAGNWRPIDLATLKRNKDALLDISIGERIGFGARDVAGSIPSGFGRLAEFAGAERLGGALVEFGEGLKTDEFDQARQAAVAQSENIFQSIAGAVPQGAPSVGVSIGSSILGGAIGGAAGGPLGVAIGAAIGGASTIFPMMVDSAYNTALQQQGEDFVNSDRGRAEILGTALATTGIQIIPGMQVTGKVVPVVMQRAATQVANKATSGIAGEAAKIGFSEGMAEMMALVVEQVAFDPETRRMMSQGEVQAMLPYVTETYGREAAVAFAAGAILGGSVGAVTGAITRQAPSEETNLLEPEEEPTTGGPLIPTQAESAGPEFQQPIRGTGPQGVLPMRGLGGQIERARRSRAVGYQPPRTGEQTNLLDRPPTAQGEPQLSLDLQEPAPIQGELFSAPGAQQLRRGVQAVENLIPPAPPVEAGTAQGELFTRRGLPTAAARAATLPRPEPGAVFGRIDGSPFRTEVSALGQRKRVARETGIPVNELEVVEADGGFFLTRAGEETIQPRSTRTSGEEAQTQEQENAFQESSTEAVLTRKRTGTSEEVGEGVTSTQRSAGESQEGGTTSQAQETQQTDEGQAETVQEDVIPEGTYDSVEDAWEALRPEGFAEVAFTNLSPAKQTILSRAYQSNILSYRLVEELATFAETAPSKKIGRDTPILDVDETGVARIKSLNEISMQSEDDLGLSDFEYLQEAMNNVEEATSNAEYSQAIADVIGWVRGSDSNITPEQRAQGYDFLFSQPLPQGSDMQNGIYLYGQSNLGGKSVVQATTKNGELTDFFKLLIHTGTVNSMMKKYRFSGVPKHMRLADTKIAKNVETNEPVSTDKGFENAEALSREINRINSLVGRTRTDTLENYRKNLTELYTKVVENGQQDFEVDPVRQTTLADYFLADGSPRIIERDGRAIVSPTEDAEAAPRILTDFSEWDAAAEERITELGLGDFAEFGRFSTLDGDPITKPMEIGRVRMQVNTFRNKLRVKPKTFVFRTQADLQAKNPELYQRAVDARPQGDFDTKLAAGYSFGDGKDATVIIFSDRIKTTSHLNFVLAHETLGHFGFRSIVSSRDFNKFMKAIYDTSGETSALVQDVDATMNAKPEMSLAEAVEEYLADYAAQLDVNLIARIKNFIRNALNKLGIKFSDDAARYFINQSRRYVRNGNRSSMFTTSEVISRMKDIETGGDPDGTGRFAPTYNLREHNIMAGTLQILPEESIDKAVKFFKDLPLNTPAKWDKFKNSVFNLFAFRARENEGLSEGHEIISISRAKAMEVRRAAQEKLAPVLDRAIVDALSNVAGIGGATKQDVKQVNYYLYEGLRYALNKFDASVLDGGSLFTLNENGDLVRNQTEIDRLFDIGNISLWQMRNGFSYVNTYLDGDGKEVKETVKVPGIEGLTEDSIEWKGYIAAREVMRDVELELLEAKKAAFIIDKESSFRDIGLDITEAGALSNQSRQLLLRIYDRYRDLYTKGMERDEDGNIIFNTDAAKEANDFIVTANRALIAMESADTDEIAAERTQAFVRYFPDVDPVQLSNALELFKAERVEINEESSDTVRFSVQNRMKELILNELAEDQADIYVRHNLATGYVPLARRGSVEVIIEAFDSEGNKVMLTKDYKNQIAYMLVETEADGVNLRDQANDIFEGNIYKVQGLNVSKGMIEEKEVTLRARAAVIKSTVATPDNLNLNSFTQGLKRYGINLPPQQLERIILDLTTQNNRARNKLKREFIEGFDPDALRAVAEHVEGRASTIAKTAMRPRLAELTNFRIPETRNKWLGDKEKLARLKANWEAVKDNPNASPGEVHYATKEYSRYLYMYNKTKPADGVEQGMKYFNEFANLMNFIQENKDINESDFARGPVVSAVRASTSIMQLGGSIATGALNYMALYTNYLPYMMHYNAKNGFGGGFAFGDVNRELFRAMNKVGLAKSVADTRLNTAEFYDQIAESESLQKQYDLLPHEARFMAQEIRGGVMIPAQMNSLTELALGRIKSAALRRTIEGYMWTFNATERGSRRSAGLAAYRLEYKRRVASGVSEKQAAEFARQFAVETLETTLGDYSVTNRPAAWRSGLQSFLYIYKIFPTTSIQTLSRLPRKGQLQMLGTLWLLSGVQGLPFAEDLEDMIDTIAQGLGLNMGSVRYEASKLVDELMPGASPYVFSGMLRGALPFDLSSRTSLGDFIPGTALFVAGSSTTRELAEVAGPAWSMIDGVGTFISNSFKAATTKQVTFEDVLREAPVTGMRMFGDALAYTQSGAIVDKRGYVVSDEMHWGIVASRLLGFYPTAAAQQYEVIRISKRLTDYQREVSAGFRYGWIKAKIAGDEVQARAIEDAVREWNVGARGTALEIRDFRKNANRSLREARRPAVARLRKSAPIAAREDMDNVADLMGY